MFLGEKDPDHKPPGKNFIIQLKNVALYALIVSAIFLSKFALVLALAVAAILIAYDIYLFVTKQTYMQFLHQKKIANEAKIAKYKK